MAFVLKYKYASKAASPNTQKRMKEDTAQQAVSQVGRYQLAFEVFFFAPSFTVNACGAVGSSGSEGEQQEQEHEVAVEQEQFEPLFCSSGSCRLEREKALIGMNTVSGRDRQQHHREEAGTLEDSCLRLSLFGRVMIG